MLYKMNGADNEDQTMTFDKLMSLPVAFQERHHQSEVKSIKELTPKAWRPKDRMKTVSVALTLCININVDPPDVVKTSPCARKECWLDPFAQEPQKSSENIGAMLQQQYERWQPRARYKCTLDPTTEEVRRLCTTLRRNSKEERVLYHYNGHGVPRPTNNGEIWVFNDNYTQYIPLSIYDLQSWMGSPSIYVYDCSCAGQILKSYMSFADQREQDLLAKGKDPTPAKEIRSCIQLAACSENQLLPMNPEVPADLFTACLTTPIKTALQWFYYQKHSHLNSNITLEQIEKLPGKLGDRRTPLGELNWIFTAITDTIAWNVLPRDVFHRLFRQDLMVASLFRNFLLAERIMRSYKCTPVSEPRLPPTFIHPMWDAWDNAVDICISQIPDLLNDPEYVFKNSEFFSQQLTAFQGWLSLGAQERHPPEQLPIVLQVLLSQVHRVRALDLLGCFLDLGPWAVNLALSVGIFPYVLKLLQSLAKDLRPMLVFIWAKILAIDGINLLDCQGDLVKDDGHLYFIKILQDYTQTVESRAMAVFVLAEIVKDYSHAQEACLQANIVPTLLEQLESHNGTYIISTSPNLRQWICICLGRMWANYSQAKWRGVREKAHEHLYALLEDKHAQVRTAALYALGQFVNFQPGYTTEQSANVNQAIGAKLAPMHQYEGSPIVRAELINSLQSLVSYWDSSFVDFALRFAASSDGTSRCPIGFTTAPPSFVGDVVVAVSPSSTGSSPPGGSCGSASGRWAISHNSNEHLLVCNDDQQVSECIKRLRRVSITSPGAPYNSIIANIWKTLEDLTHDPAPHVAHLAKIVYNNVLHKALELGQKTNSPTSVSSIRNGVESLNRNRNRRTLSSGSRTSNRTSNRSIRNRNVNSMSSICENLVVTEFCEWTASAFAQPSCLIGSEGTFVNQKDAAKHELRRRKVEDYMRTYQSIDASFHRLDLPRSAEQQFLQKLNHPPIITRFHPDTNHLISADRTGKMSVWDWASGTKKNEFQNNDFGVDMDPTITDMLFINQHTADCMLAVATDDGAVRVWNDDICVSNCTPRMVTAWRSSTDIIAANDRQVGTIMCWNQQDLRLYTAGDSKSLNVWNVETELQELAIPTGNESRLSSISYHSHNKLLAAGCDNGGVQLFDFRVKNPHQSLLSAHGSKVINVSYVGHDLLLTASESGSIKLWDVKKNCEPYSTIRQKKKGPMLCANAHSQLLVVACATKDHAINLLDFNGQELGAVKSYDGFLGKTIGQVNCLSYHPLQANLAVGTVDCYLSVHSGASRR